MPRRRNRDTGRANRGMPFERELENMHDSWRGQVLPDGRVVGGRGVVVVKVPTDMVIQRGDGGAVVGARVRKGKRVVDYLGALEDGEAIALEAKSFKGHRFPLSKVTAGQCEFMRQWHGIGLLLIRMEFQGRYSNWAVPFKKFIEALDTGVVKAWPLPGQESKRADLIGEPTLGDVGVRLTSGCDWHRALRRGRLDDLLFESEE